MALPDYAKSQNERLWFVDESTFNTLAQPSTTDAVIPLPGATLPPVLSEFTPSLERSSSAGRREQIKRKKPPGEFSVTFYIKSPVLPGVPPSIGLALKKAMGVEVVNPKAFHQTAITGDDNDLRFTARQGGTAGNAITIAYIVAGLNTPLTVVVTGTAIVVNVATDGAGAPTSTASQVLAAVEASQAARDLVTVALAAGNDGSGVVDAFGATNLAGGSGTSEVRYRLATAIEETSFSIWHWTDNMMTGKRGCQVNTVTIGVSGSDEGRVTLAGFMANEVFAGVGALQAGISDADTTIPLEAGQARRFQVGPGASDVIHIQIGSEIIKVVGVNYSADTLDVTGGRGAMGSVAAAHLIGAAVEPWKPGADPHSPDKIAPLTIGSITIGGLTVRGISFEAIANNNLEFRLDEYGEPVATGSRRTDKRDITGTLRVYSRQQTQAFRSDLERELEEPTTVVAGSVPGRMRISIPKLKFNDVNQDGGGPEFIYELPFQGFESSAGNDELELIFD